MLWILVALATPLVSVLGCIVGGCAVGALWNLFTRKVA